MGNSPITIRFSLPWVFAEMLVADAGWPKKIIFACFLVLTRLLEGILLGLTLSLMIAPLLFACPGGFIRGYPGGNCGSRRPVDQRSAIRTAYLIRDFGPGRLHRLAAFSLLGGLTGWFTAGHFRNKRLADPAIAGVGVDQVPGIESIAQLLPAGVLPQYHQSIYPLLLAQYRQRYSRHQPGEWQHQVGFAYLHIAYLHIALRQIRQIRKGFIFKVQRAAEGRQAIRNSQKWSL